MYGKNMHANTGREQTARMAHSRNYARIVRTMRRRRRHRWVRCCGAANAAVANMHIAHVHVLGNNAGAGVKFGTLCWVFVCALNEIQYTEHVRHGCVFLLTAKSTPALGGAAATSCAMCERE